MKQTELFRRIKSYATMTVVMVMAMLSAGCGSDDDVLIGDVVEDKDGWYKYADKEKHDIVYAGFVISADEEHVTVDTYSPDSYTRLYCVNITKKNCDVGDDVKLKIRRFRLEPHVTTLPNEETVEVELLSVEKP